MRGQEIAKADIRKQKFPFRIKWKIVIEWNNVIFIKKTLTLGYIFIALHTTTSESYVHCTTVASFLVCLKIRFQYNKKIAP